MLEQNCRKLRIRQVDKRNSSMTGWATHPDNQSGRRFRKLRVRWQRTYHPGHRREGKQHDLRIRFCRQVLPINPSDRGDARVDLEQTSWTCRHVDRAGHTHQSRAHRPEPECDGYAHRREGKSESIHSGLVGPNHLSDRCSGAHYNNAAHTNGNPIQITRPNGAVTTMTYDAKGNLLTSTDPIGATTTFTYEPNFNQVKTIRDPKGKHNDDQLRCERQSDSDHRCIGKPHADDL